MKDKKAYQKKYMQEYFKRVSGICHICGEKAGEFKVTICDNCVSKVNREAVRKGKIHKDKKESIKK